jgi:hypothetical protein
MITNNNENQIKAETMTRIYFLYYSKRIISRISSLYGKIAFLSFFTYIVIAFVSIKHVIKNMHSIGTFSDFYHFMFSAFLNTRISVQISFIIILGLIAFIGRDMFRYVFLALTSRNNIYDNTYSEA